MNKKRFFQRPLSSRLKTKEAHYENDSGTQHSDIWISTADVVKTLVSETEEKSPGGWKAREKAHRATRPEVTQRKLLWSRGCACGNVSPCISQEWRGELKAGVRGGRTTTGKQPGLQQLLYYIELLQKKWSRGQIEKRNSLMAVPPLNLGLHMAQGECRPTQN